MKSEIMPDQTQFVTESPLYEEPESTELPEQILFEQELKQQQQKKIKWIIIGVVGFLCLMMSILILIKLGSGINLEQNPEIEEVELDEFIVEPFNQRVLELKKELELADPNQEELPFPPIDFEISLEE